MNPKEENKAILAEHMKYIKPLERLDTTLSHSWPGECIENVRRYIMTDRAEDLHITPIYNQYASYQSQAPHMYMVEHMGVGVLALSWTRGGHISDRVIGVIKNGVVTLMNVDKLVNNDQEKALTAIIGGDIHTNSSDYPMNPSRLTIDKKEYPLSNGMQLRLNIDGNTQILKCDKDYKVRSDRKVTLRVNKFFDEYIKNAKAMAKLIAPDRPENSPYNWDEAFMSKLARQHLGIDQRLRWARNLDNYGLFNTTRKLIDPQMDYEPIIDDETGTITVTKNFDIPKKIYEAAKRNDFGPMAYLFLEARLDNVEKRLLNAIRALEGGFRMERV